MVYLYMPVLWIRVRFWGLPDPDPSIMKKKSKKNLNFYVLFCDFFVSFILEDWCKCTFKNYRNKQKKIWKQNLFLLASRKPLHWRKEQDPDPYQNVTVSRIHNTA